MVTHLPIMVVALAFSRRPRIFMAHVLRRKELHLPLKNENLSGLDIPTQESRTATECRIGLAHVLHSLTFPGWKHKRPEISLAQERLGSLLWRLLTPGLALEATAYFRNVTGEVRRVATERSGQLRDLLDQLTSCTSWQSSFSKLLPCIPPLTAGNSGGFMPRRRYEYAEQMKESAI
jgi:hypothetical protein